MLFWMGDLITLLLEVTKQSPPSQEQEDVLQLISQKPSFNHEKGQPGLQFGNDQDR